MNTYLCWPFERVAPLRFADDERETGNPVRLSISLGHQPGKNMLGVSGRRIQVSIDAILRVPSEAGSGQIPEIQQPHARVVKPYRELATRFEASVESTPSP